MNENAAHTPTAGSKGKQTSHQAKQRLIKGSQ